MSHRKPYFVVSCARSGSTSLTKILDSATNGDCVLEPQPNLNRETRDMREGRLADPDGTLESSVVKRVLTAQRPDRVYGEKNVTYGPFLDRLHRRLDPRFVYIRRDGRDVVRSLMDWHERMFGTIYRECSDPGDLSPRALQSAGALPVHEDTSDYSRPRPLPGEAIALEWEDLSREEMCAYYWATANRIYRDQLARLPADAWVEIDYTRASADEIVEIGTFLGLEGLDRDAIAEMLDRRINSIGDRIGEDDRYPHWGQWDSGRRDRFWRIAGPMMLELGYAREGREWCPPHYGRWWKNHDGGLDWYEWMFEGREPVHRDLIAWATAPANRVESVVDFGCGLEVGYTDAFAEKRYVGIDISHRNVDWCRRNRKNPKHAHWCADFVEEPLPEKFDLVFSSGTIDNTYDIDACLRAMVRASKKWIHVTCYRGWFPELDEHRYSYAPQHDCFYNDLSPKRAARTLREAGCTDVRIDRVASGKDDIPFETRIIARVPHRS
ncbi:MAG: methyltransferase domain-containing protein [Planctomycetes bacterium]|nr:methyltransferase domain-containing protein [Planctomycetota bacterium]